MRVIVYLLNLIILFVEQYVILFKIIKFEHKNHIIRYIVFGICSIILLCLLSFVFNTYIDIIGVLIVTILISLMIKRKKQIPFVFIISILSMFTSYMTATFIYKLCNINPYLWKSSINSSLYTLIQSIVYVAVWALILKNRTKKYLEYEFEFYQTLLLGFGVIAFIFFVNSILRLAFLDVSVLQITPAFTTALIIVALYIAICLFALYSNIKTHKKDVELLKYKSHLIMQKKYYEELLKKEEATKAFRHDLNNHLFCILNFIENSESSKAKEYINKLIDKTISFQNTNFTGNNIIDMVINDIFTNNKDIELHWKGNVPNNLFIQDSDLVSLFYNIFNNAVQATKKCNTNNKQITGFAKIVDNTLLINVENPYIEKIEFDDFGLPQTTKIDKKNHGYGIKNIKEIVDKYNGLMEFKTENNFIIEIIFINIIY